MRKAAALLPPALLRPLSGPVVLFFHGVEEQIADPELQSNHHSLDDFADIVGALKQHFEVAPLAQLPHALAHPQRHRRTVFLTSDDGYANTVTVAAPLLRSLGLPSTLFISTRHVDTGEFNPMTVARAFLRAAPEDSYNLPGLKGSILLKGDRQAVASCVLAKFRKLQANQAQSTVHQMRAILEAAGVRLRDILPSSERFLNWDQVRALAHSGVTIGAHADWHWPLHADEQPETLKLQAERSRQRVEAEIGPCSHFAFPFGNIRDIGAAGWKAVRNAGYRYGFTTLSGTLSGAQNPFLLPRYGLQPQEPRLAGLLPLLRAGNPRITRWQHALA